MPVSEAISELKWLWFRNPHPLADMEDFDLASRGARGSLRFLFRLPQNWLPSLGAAVTILALAIEPMTQLVVQSEECLVSQPGSATIGRTNNYTHAGVARQENNPRFNLDNYMSAAIYNGLLNSPEVTASNLPRYCPSGNCTFQRYSSLAMCYKVTNISDQVLSSFSVSNSTYQEFYLPSGLSITSGSAFATASVRSPNNWIDSGRRMTENSPLFEFNALMGARSCEQENGFPNPGCTVPFAVSIHLSPCIKTYNNVFISSSNLTQEIVSSTNLARICSEYPYYSLAGDFPATPNTDCSPANTPSGRKIQATKQLASGIEYAIDNGDYPYFDNMTNLDEYVQWYDPECAYEFSAAPTEAISWFLAKSFFGYDPPTSQRLLSVQWGYPNVSAGDWWLEKLYAKGMANMSTVSSFADDLTNAMTVQMLRNSDPNNSRPVEGALLESRGCVQVAWLWLLLDFILLPAGVLFFMLMLWQSCRVNRASGVDVRGPWKSSTLALLWCNLPDQGITQNGKLNSLTEIRSLSASQNFKLVQTDPEPTITGTPPILVNGEHLNTNQRLPHSDGDEEKGRLARSATGRWTLDGVSNETLPSRQSSVREWAKRISDQIPLS